MPITVTEALSELNLIGKKVEKKKETLLRNLVKPKHLKDAIEGGSPAFIKSELQAINDLQSRHIKIKGAVAKANTENTITIDGQTDTIHNWLNWKRDIAQKQLNLLNTIHTTVKTEMDKLMRQPQVYKDDAGNTHLLEVESNVDYVAMVKEAEKTQEVFDKLDGQLSLKNATVVLNV